MIIKQEEKRCFVATWLHKGVLSIVDSYTCVLSSICTDADPLDKGPHSNSPKKCIFHFSFLWKKLIKYERIGKM